MIEMEKKFSAAPINPLRFARIGSSFSSLDGRFRPSVIQLTDKQGITKILTTHEEFKRMSGVSSYAYSEAMNQASVGLSGGFAVSKALEYKASCSGFTRSESAKSDHKVHLEFSVQLTSGLEHVDFDNLTANHVLASLNGSAHDDALRVLAEYVKAVKKITVSDDSKDEAAGTAYSDWYNSVRDFFHDHGDGMVVGVLWGAVGLVQMDLWYEDYSSSWRYSTKGSFQKITPTDAVSIEAAFDGSNRHRTSTVQVESNSFYSGASVKGAVDEWHKKVNDLLFEKISNIKMLDFAPDKSKAPPPPDVPDFLPPEPKKETKKATAKLPDLKQIRKAAIEYGFQQLKERRPELTLKEFEALVAKKVDVGKAKTLLEDVKFNNFDTLHSDPCPASLSDPRFVKSSSQSVHKSSAQGDNTHAVLGVYIAHWSSIFPWMATAFSNEFDDDSEVRLLLKKRCMVQDLLCLSRLYSMAASSGLSLSLIDIPSPRDIAASFSSAFEFLQKNFHHEQAIGNTLKRLSSKERKIYGVWNRISIFRNAELGLGVVIYRRKNGRVIEKWTIDPSMPEFTEDGVVVLKKTDCQFEGENYTAFRRAAKVLPLISPDGRIYAFGPCNGILRGIRGSSISFDFQVSSGNLDFRLKKNSTHGKYLSAEDNQEEIALFPIPFDGAYGKDPWKGPGMSANVGAGPIRERFKNLLDEMRSQLRYDLSSTEWRKDWKAKDYYRISKIKASYLGIAPEPKDIKIFKKRTSRNG